MDDKKIQHIKIGLTAEEIEELRNVFRNFGKLNVVLLYGSRAKGNYQLGSDVDLALLGDELTLLDILDIRMALDDLYLPYKFDLTLYHNIHEPALKKHINRVGIELYRNK